MKILVYGAVPRQPNLGVSALAEGSAAVLRRAFPEADIRFRSTGPGGDGPISLSHTTPLLREMLLNRIGLRKWTQSFDLVCDIRGGDSLTDIYTVKRLVKLSVFPLYAAALRVPLVLLPQTIGPFEHRRSRLLARLLLSSARAVMARDPRSAEAASRLGRPVDLTATDVVFAVEPPAAPAGAHDVLLNVSGLLWEDNPHVDAAGYRDTVRRLIDGLLDEGRDVSLLAHVRGDDESPGDNDRSALAALRQDYGDRVRHVVPEDLADVRAHMAGARIVIGARMHACLNALSVGVPAVPLAYSRKFAPLLDDLGWRHTVDLRGSSSSVAEDIRRRMDAAEADDVAAVVATAHARMDDVVKELEALRAGPR